MKTIRVKESIWEKLQKLKLKWRKRNMGEVIEQLIPEENMSCAQKEEKEEKS